MTLRPLMLSTDLQRGGLPMRLARLALRLRQSDVEPIVACLAPRGPLSEELEAGGIETFSCDARGPFDARCLARLAKKVGRLDPDLIHASLLHANVAARLVGRLDRNRPIITSTVTIEIERSWHRLLESLTGGWSDFHVANSWAVARHVCEDLGFPRERVVVIGNAVPFEEIDRTPSVDRRENGLRADVPLIMWAGRMDRVKNLPTFVEVVKRVRRRLPVQAVLVGDGGERGRIAGLIRERKLESVISMTSWSDNVCAWLKTADCLLFPSFTEGSPNVVLEAMAAGCAVVASDIPACRELLADGVHGRLCGAKDIDGMACAVESLLLDGAARGTLVRAARQRVRTHHDAERVAACWRHLYEVALSA